MVEFLDPEFASRVDAAKVEGTTLRYLARVDVSGPQPEISVGPVWVDENHPAARLRGAESFVAFYTERYGAAPLVVAMRADAQTILRSTSTRTGRSRGAGRLRDGLVVAQVAASLRVVFFREETRGIRDASHR